jgi:hypothetical protein
MSLKRRRKRLRFALTWLGAGGVALSVLLSALAVFAVFNALRP